MIKFEEFCERRPLLFYYHEWSYAFILISNHNTKNNNDKGSECVYKNFDGYSLSLSSSLYLPVDQQNIFMCGSNSENYMTHIQPMFGCANENEKHRNKN